MAMKTVKWASLSDREGAPSPPPPPPPLLPLPRPPLMPAAASPAVAPTLPPPPLLSPLAAGASPRLAEDTRPVSSPPPRTARNTLELLRLLPASPSSAEPSPPRELRRRSCGGLTGECSCGRWNFTRSAPVAERFFGAAARPRSLRRDFVDGASVAAPPPCAAARTAAYGRTGELVLVIPDGPSDVPWTMIRPSKLDAILAEGRATLVQLNPNEWYSLVLIERHRGLPPPRRPPAFAAASGPSCQFFGDLTKMLCGFWTCGHHGRQHRSVPGITHGA